MLRIYLIPFFFLIQASLYAVAAISTFEFPIKTELKYSYPTERFLEHYGHDYVLQELKNRGLSLEHRIFFEHIIPHEELGFFGYHSSKQEFRIFQDIIRFILEEVCDLEIKQDFHFLRIPGQSILNRQSAEQFLQHYPNVNNHLFLTNENSYCR